MIVQSTAAIAVNGTTRTVATSVSLDEIDSVGVRWSKSFSEIGGKDVAESLGTLVNIAEVCHAHGRSIQELGALRLAQRITRFKVADINTRVTVLQKAVHFESRNLPKDIRIVCIDESEAEFTEIISAYTGLHNFWFPGAAFDGVLGPGESFFFKGRIHNVSFHILKGKRRLATVPCFVAEDGGISWTALWGWEYPIVIHFAQDCDQRKQVCTYAIEYLTYLSKAYAARSFTIAEVSQPDLTLFRILGTRRTMSAQLYDVPLVDLTSTEQAIFKGVRDSYKSHINWSKTNLDFEYLRGSEVTNDTAPLLYDLMTYVHARPIAKHGNLMPLEMFLMFTEKIGRGEGEFAIARTKDGSICGMIATTYENDTAWYGLGGSLSVGKINPGCFLVYNSILRAKAHGLKKYHVGRVSPPTLSINGFETALRRDMHNNLNFFKRGFSDTFEIMYVYTVFPPNIEKAEE